MKNLIIKDILKVTNGNLIIGDENEKCKNFSNDTRKINEGDTYLGLKGENFDGNTLWKEALEKGAKTIIIQGIDFSKEDLTKFEKENKNIIEVKDTKIALQKIAEYKRSLYGEDFILVGVTGSVGKTSTKDMIASVFSQKYKTLKTEGNFNNEIGLPLTLLKLEDHQAAVIEMGMNHFGEIRLLTNIAKPTISVITNIGTSHIGNLGSRQNILKAKLEILEGMKNPRIVINNDNDMLNSWNENNKEDIEIHTYGIENDSEVMAKDIVLNENSSDFECIIGKESFKIHVPVGGVHFVYNAICAIAVAKVYNISNEEIKKGIESFTLTKKRMDITDLKNNIKIINDAYNASLESMQASLKNLSSYKNRRKIAVLGDMFELGEYSEKMHRKVGDEFVKQNIDVLVCLGENSKFICEEAENLKGSLDNIKHFKNREDLIEFLKQFVKAGDVVLFKASNGMKFFDIANEMINYFSKSGC